MRLPRACGSPGPHFPLAWLARDLELAADVVGSRLPRHGTAVAQRLRAVAADVRATPTFLGWRGPGARPRGGAFAPRAAPTPRAARCTVLPSNDGSALAHRHLCAGAHR